MKVDVLAGIIEKPANELQELLNLAADVNEIDDAIAAQQISEHITETKKVSFGNGKNEGKGWGTKEALKSVHAVLKNDFGIDSDDAIEGLKTIKSQFDSHKNSGTADEKLKRDIEILKEKNILLTASIEAKEKNEILATKKNLLTKKLDEIINSDFGEATERLKLIAKSEFMSSVHWDVEDNDISLFHDAEKTKLLKQDNKHVTLKDVALTIFKEILPVKVLKKALPDAAAGADYEAKGETLGQLYSELARAKTLEEKKSIQDKIEKISKRQK
jgi:hypothetical protein